MENIYICYWKILGKSNYTTKPANPVVTNPVTTYNSTISITESADTTLLQGEASSSDTVTETHQ